MKTIARTLVAISILMISMPVIAGNFQPSSTPVHYKVQIHLPKDMTFLPEHVYVVITDARNQPVVPPQLFSTDNLMYEFNEYQTVIGTREAKLIYFDGTRHMLFHSAPDIQTGKFIPGGSYDFNIYILIESAGVGAE